MQRRKALAVTIVIALLAAIGPVLAAIHLAQQQGLNTEFERVTGYARDVVYRSDRAVMQMVEVLDILEAEKAASPCSVGMLQLMRQLGLSMEFIKAAGHVSDERLQCSTLGRHGEKGLALGPPDATTESGIRLRLSAPIPLAADTPFITVERGDFIAITHRSQAVDLTVEQDNTIFATFNPQTGEIRTASGAVDPGWIEALGEADETTFIDEDHLVAVVRSGDVSMTGAIAAVSTRHLDERIREFIVFLLPIGLITGAVLTASVVFVARQQTSLHSQIRAGLKRREFFLVYQPIVDLHTGRWTGAEALLRWRRSDGQVIYPDTFIPIAEQTGLTDQLTDRVLELIRKDMGTMIGICPDFSVSINLSARDLRSTRRLQELPRLLRDCGGREGQLVVELTESMLAEESAAATTIADLREQGIRVAIDDFGTGYCGLSYLDTIQFDTLKIDRLFVEAIDTEAATNQVVTHVIRMARTLGLEIIAEGVETNAQAEYLRGEGVGRAQGWLYGKPVTARHFLAAWHAVR